MNTTAIYNAYSWRVFQHNRFVGYVIAMSEIDALRKAYDKFGSNLWVERASLT